MIEPESDYQTWILIASSTVDDPGQFAYFLPSIERLINSIMETNSLPSPIESQTASFINSLNDSILENLLKVSQIEYNEFILYQQFLYRILDFGKYGIMSENPQILECVYTILTNFQSPIYTISPDFTYPILCEYAFKQSFYKMAYQAIANCPDNFDLFTIYYDIIDELSFYDDDFNWTEFSMNCAIAILEIAKKNPRLDAQTVNKIFSQILHSSVQNTVSCDDFCPPWLNFLLFFVKSGIFEKQLYALNQIENLLKYPIMVDGVVHYFSNETNRPLTIFEEMKTIHPELCKPIAQILSVLAEYRIVTDQLISHLWSLHNVQHSSDLQKFFVIFSSIASTLPVEQLPRLIEQCINPADGCESEEWVNFLRALAETLGKRDGADGSFRMVRNKLLEIALTDNETKKELSNIAKKILPSIIRFWLDEEIFLRIFHQLNSLLDQPEIHDIQQIIFLFQLFGSALFTNNFELPKEESEQLLHKSFLFIQENLPNDHNCESCNAVLDFISSLCYNKDIKLSDEQLDIVFVYRQSTVFCNMITRFLLKNLVSLDHLTKLIMGLNDIDENIFGLVKNIIIVSNNLKKTTHVPVLHEDMVWNLSLIESAQRTKFASFLCSIYSNNDKEQLSDYTMMNSFIQKWNTKFNQIETAVQKKNALFLLKVFINEIESMVDLEMYSIRRHTFNFDFKTIHVEVTSNNLPCKQSYDLPENTTIMSLKQKVSKTSLLPMNSFVLCRYSKPLILTNTIKMVAGNSDKIIVTVSLMKLKDVFLETRDILPSQLILQQYPETFDLLISLLKENEEIVSNEAKLVLNFLPTNSGTLLQIEEIKRCKSFNYQSFFPPDHPHLFMYNFESLQEVYQSENDKDYLMKSGGFLYFIDVLSPLNDPQLNYKIKQFLKKEMDAKIVSEIGQTICDKLIPFLSKTATDSQIIQFTIFYDLLIPIFEILNSNIQLPDTFSEEIMKPLLFSPFLKIRHKIPYLFIHLPISLSMFCNLFEFVNEENASTFYETLLPHVNKYTLNEVIYAETNEIDLLIDKIKEGVNNQPSYLLELLSILNKLLEISLKSPDSNLISKTDQEFITLKLIDRFLNPDPREKEKKLFTCAIQCLSKMLNDQLLNHLTKLHTGRTNYPDWDIDGDSNIVSPNGHCGLVNLGATCFLNSTLQQFFAIPDLRKAVFLFNGNNRFIDELRILFAEMYLSNGELINPTKLVDVWTGWDGEPMNPEIQQDAFEFTQMLIDKLEGGLTPKFLNQIFGGTQIVEFVGLSETYQSSSVQPFTSLTLPIQDSTNVYEAFSKMQNPNFFTGENQYYAESLHKKIDAKNIQRLGKLPEILILQLSRFEYNYQLGIRSKINSVFNFPVDLDLKDFMANNIDQITKYELRGVVMHEGTADFGHYTSYIKDLSTDKWFLYNDSYVTEVTVEEVLEKGAGKEGHSLSGYILFYDRIDTIPKNKELLLAKPSISQRLVHQIQNENRQKDEYRLFCSEPYFNFMLLLASADPQFALISLKYYFDTFPFTLHVKRAGELETELCSQLRNSPSLAQSFCQFLNNGPFECSLIYCPSSQVRIGAFNMIKILPIDDIGPQFVKRIISSITSITPYYAYFEQCFDLLYDLISNSPSILDFAMNRCPFIRLLVKMFINDIPNYIENHCDNEVFYSNCNLTSILNILAIMYEQYESNELDQLFEFVLEKETFMNLLSSKSSIHSITNLLKSFDDNEMIKPFLISFAEKSGIHVHYFRIGHLLLDYFNIEGFNIISRCHFLIGSRPNNKFDLAMLVYMISIKDHELRDRLFDKCELWLFDLLTDESYECRITTEYIIASLIPDRVFMNSISFNAYNEINNIESKTEIDNFISPMQALPQHEIESEMTLLFDYKDSVDLNVSKKIFDCLIARKSDFINKLQRYVVKTNNDYQNSNPLHFGAFIGHQYIDAIDRLSVINQIDISQHLIDIAMTIIQPKSEIFDITLSRICVALKRLRFNKMCSIGSDFDFDRFFMSFYPHPSIESPMIKLRASQNSQYSTPLASLKVSLYFFNDMKESIEGNYPFEFISGFLRFYAFSSAAKLCKKYEIIESYIKYFARSTPDDLFVVLQNNLEAFSNSFFSGVLISLDYLNSTGIKYKLPLINFLWDAVKQKEQFTMNELVVKTFKYNVDLSEDLITNENLISLISLLNSPGLLEDGHECIWKLIFEKKNDIPLVIFASQYKFKGDWVNVAKFILEHSEVDHQEIIQLAVEAARESIEAFSILFDFLLNHAPAHFFSVNFAQAIIEHEIGLIAADVVTRYIKLVTNEKKLDQEALLAPLANKFNTRAKFLNDILVDFMSNETRDARNDIKDNDIDYLLGLLMVLDQFDQGKQLMQEEREKLKAVLNSQNLSSKLNSPHFIHLKKSL